MGRVGSVVGFQVKKGGVSRSIQSGSVDERCLPPERTYSRYINAQLLLQRRTFFLCVAPAEETCRRHVSRARASAGVTQTVLLYFFFSACFLSAVVVVLTKYEVLRIWILSSLSPGDRFGRPFLPRQHSSRYNRIYFYSRSNRSPLS